MSLTMTAPAEFGARRFQPYSKYARTEFGWLGAVPARWDVKPFKRIVNCPAVKGSGELLPFVALENIHSHRGALVIDFEWVDKASDDYVTFRGNDLLFGKLRPYLCKVLQTDRVGCCPSELLVFRPAGDEVIPRFLYYLLLSTAFRDVAVSTSYGTKMPRTSWEILGRHRFALPSKTEQNAIAAFLDRETAKIDALVAKKERLIELLREKRTALITHAVTTGLDPNAPMKDSGVDWLGEIPASWSTTPLKRITTRVDVGIAEAATHAYNDDGVPLIRSTNVKPNRLFLQDLLHIEKWFAESNRSKYLRSGDLVTVRTGNPGTTAVIPVELDLCQCFTLLISTLRPNHLPEFYSYFMNAEPAKVFFEVEGWGTAQTNISVPILQALVVVELPFGNQCEIVRYLDTATERLDQLISTCRTGVVLLREYRTALISAAVTGKIDVRNEAA